MVFLLIFRCVGRYLVKKDVRRIEKSVGFILTPPSRQYSAVVSF